MLRSFTFRVVIRLILILVAMMVMAIIFRDDRFFFNKVILGIIIIIQIFEMIRFINRTNRELAKFLLAIRHSDFSMNFKSSGSGRSFQELNSAFSEIIGSFKATESEKEAQFHYLKLVIDAINIGIISLENEENMVLVNNSAEEILNIEGIRNWRILKEKHPDFVYEVETMRESGRKLIKLNINGDSKTLSVDMQSIIMLDKTYKHITFQDIRGEIEQTEIAAWHTLIRILTHEIMNSITPISSLTETMQSMLLDDDQQISLNDITDEMITDLAFSLKTIHKRSKGMLSFVDDYRKLTKIGKPKLQNTDISNLFDNIKQLMHGELAKHNIKLSISVAPEPLNIQLDQHLIEQVLINLITNSIHALSKRPGPVIQLAAFNKDKRSYIEVRDNGHGIPEKEIREIFVPFFTTKKEGSGIGLSLSKQIMLLHNGNMSVVSSADKGTSVFLIFKQHHVP